MYRDPSKVDARLVDEILAPSQDPGAREVFVSVITGPPGPKPWQLMPQLKGPLLVLWGDKDTLTPADGPVGKYLKVRMWRSQELAMHVGFMACCRGFHAREGDLLSGLRHAMLP